MAAPNGSESSKHIGIVNESFVLSLSQEKEIVSNTKQEQNFKKDVEFEEALDEAKFGKFNYFLIVICGLAITNVFLETMSVSFILPVSGCDLNLTTFQKGVLGSMGFAGIISSSHLVGFLADTKGRRAVIRPFLLIAFIITVLSSFANTFWLLTLLRYLNGFCISGGSGTIYAYLGEFHSEKQRSRVIMAASFIFGLGGFLLPFIGMVTINGTWSVHIPFLDITYKPWRVFLIICGFPGFICALSLFALPESPKFLLSIGKKIETLEVLRKMFTWNTGKNKDEYCILSLKDEPHNQEINSGTETNNSRVPVILRSMWNQTAPLFSKEYARRTIILCMLQFWTITTAYGLYLWFPLILNRMMEISDYQPGVRLYICDAVHSTNNTQPTENETCYDKLEPSTFYHSIALEVLYCFGYIIIGAVINSIDKVHILMITLAMCGISGCAAIFVNIPLVAVYLMVVLLLAGLGIPIINALTVDLFPTNLRAMAVCIELMIGRLGSAFGSNIIGALLDRYCEGAFLFLGISLILAGILGYLLPKTKPIEQVVI